MAVKIQLRNDTAANWTSNNPVLLLGEIGIDTTNTIVKIGNGSTAWSSLTSSLLTASSPTITTPTIDQINASASSANTSLYTGAGTGTTTIGFNSGSVIMPGTGGLTIKGLTLTSATTTGTIDSTNTNGVLFSTPSGTVTIGSAAGTLALGAAATVVSLGASTGTFTIGNPTITATNATALALNGSSPAVTTTSTTASVFNTNATTLNLGGAATTVNIGATTGTTNINNSLDLAAGTTSMSAMKFSSGLVFSTQNGGIVEYNGINFFQTPNASVASNAAYGGRGMVDTSHYVMIGTATKALTNVSTIQALFNSGASVTNPQTTTLTAGSLAVAPATNYLVELEIFLTKATTTAAGVTITFAAGGTTTFSNWSLSSMAVSNAAGTAAAPVFDWATGTTANPAVVAISTTNSTAGSLIRVRGTIRTNASTSGTGTIIPSLTFSAAPGTTNTIAYGSYCKITPITNNTSTDVAIGAWA